VVTVQKVSPPSEETRKKLSEANKGKRFSEETRAKMSVAKKNMSDETRAKMSAAQKERYRDKGQAHPA